MAVWRKKLITVARYFANESGGNDETEDDAKMFGIELSKKSEKHCEVLPINWDAVMAFTAVQTQWVYSSRGALLGLNYSGVAVAFKGLGIRLSSVFEKLQILEREVINVVAQQA